MWNKLLNVVKYDKVDKEDKEHARLLKNSEYVIEEEEDEEEE